VTYLNLPSEPTTSRPSESISWPIITAILCRLLLNTARRFAYPFAPVLSRGLGVSLTSITSLIAVNQATAIIGIGFGPLADRFGYRRMMLIGMGMLSLGMLAAGIFPFYYTVMVALFLAGLGKSIFDPAIQAYVSRRVSYAKRGRVIGVLEMSWAGSTLIGIPCVAILMNRFDWQAPFYVLGGLGLVGMFGLVSLFPKNGHRKGSVPNKKRLRDIWPHLITNRPAVGAMFYAFFISVANDNLFVVYGAWLEQSFHVSVIVLGIGTGVIGLAELCGEGLTVLISDRVGLRRSIVAGLVLTIINYALIPLYGQSLWFALVGIFLVFLTYEFMLVTSLSLCTEILPDQRATMMAAFFAAAGAGRVIGALMGGHLWLFGGIWLTGLVSAGITLLALLSLMIGLKAWHPVQDG
jgi:predicted MFS family arabinose efflux permease